MKGARFLVFVSFVVVLTCASWAGADNPTVVDTIQLGQPTCCSLGGVGVNSDTNRIYVTDLSRDMLYVLDGTTHSPVAEVPIAGRPFDVAVNPFTNRVYVSSIESHAIYVVDGTTHVVIDTIPVPHEPRRLSIEFRNNLLYVADPASGSICEIDCATNSVVAIAREPGSWAMGIDAENDRVWYTIGSATQQVHEVDLDGTPGSITANSLSGRVYVTLEDGRVQVLDGHSERVEDTISVGDGPIDVAVNPLTELVYVVDFNAGTLQVISDPDGFQPPSRVLSSYLNQLLVELSTSMDGAKLVNQVQRAIIVLLDGDPDNDFMIADHLEDLIGEAENSDVLSGDQVARITSAAEEIMAMLFGS